MKVTGSVVQMFSAPGNWQTNLEKAASLVERAADQESSIVLLPELFNIGYELSPDLPLRAVEAFGPTIEWMKHTTARSGMTLMGGVAEPGPNDVLFNSLCVVSPGSEPVFYRKTHLFGDEPDYFTAGDRLLTVVVQGITVGLLMCYETGFPEISRVLALRGAEILAIPFAFGRARGRIFEVATRSRALENAAYALIACQVGVTSTMEFYGHSRIVSPKGCVIRDLEDGEGVVSCCIDREYASLCRRGEFPDTHVYLSRRRPELYGELIPGVVNPGVYTPLNERIE